MNAVAIPMPENDNLKVFKPSKKQLRVYECPDIQRNKYVSEHEKEFLNLDKEEMDILIRLMEPEE